jgi:peptidoglycan/LPS O-acetylase OafA/YrhL
VAIILVFLYHVYISAYGTGQLAWTGNVRDFANAPSFSFLALYPLSFGWWGVSLFVVISGFCVHLSTLQSKTPFSIWRFAVNRWWRIYPPYLCAFVGCLAFLHFSGAHVSGRDVVLHLALVHNLSDSSAYRINASHWAVALWMQLYLLYPVLLSITTREKGLGRSVWVLACLCIAGRAGVGILDAYGVEVPRYVYGNFLLFWFDWTLGAYVAERHLNGFGVRGAFGRLAPWALAVAVVFSFHKGLSRLAFPCVSVASAGLLEWVMAQTGKGRPPFGLRWLVSVGVVSYSLFLWHQPVLGRSGQMLRKYGGLDGNFTVLMLLIASSPIFYALSCVFWACVERPSASMGRSLSRHGFADARGRTATVPGRGDN